MFSLVFAFSILFLLGCKTSPANLHAEARSSHLDYFASIQVIRETKTSKPEVVIGKVFNDRNGNGEFDDGEQGIGKVAVSNGRDVDRTDQHGQYHIPVRDDMSLFVVQPAGWRVPTDENYIPQFAYQHKPKGSPKVLRFGGLAPTGPIPSEVNFPLKETASDNFSCAIFGDIQAYSNQEISYFRDSIIDDIVDRAEQLDCIVAVGDVVGDDLSLIPRLSNVMSTLKAPQWWAHGNHDIDFDADFDKDSADSWRNLWGPAYYAFEQGNVLFIVLDNVVYPCGPKDARLEGREFCIEEEEKKYNGRITDVQMEFVRQLLNETPKDKTLVFAHHIPFVSFIDQDATAHQTDNVKELYKLVEGREALSLSGHTHTIENLAPGDSFKGWKEVMDIDALPFRHIVAGAGSGSWYRGDLDIHGTPMALQRMGGPKGWLALQFDAQGDYVETYFGGNQEADRIAWLSISTPPFRKWLNTLQSWRDEDEDTRDPVPPVSINDLPDVKILTPDDLKNQSFLTANVWAGSTDTQVTVSINDGPKQQMSRTQQAKGEDTKIGAEFADPFSVQRQATIARKAIQSRSGILENQGYQVFKGDQMGPGNPQPQRSLADRNVHLWMYQLPNDLPIGTHVANITITDRHGRISTDKIVFEIREERPEMKFRREYWDTFQNGTPVNRTHSGSLQ